MRAKRTVPLIHQMWRTGAQIVCLTAYDAPFARIADEADVDVLLVGDSVGNVVLGYPNTVHVTMEHMVHHTRAVASVAPNAMLVADLPFGSYQGSPTDALENAVLLMRAGAQGVKLEGDYPDTVGLLVRAGIPTMGHIGMTPQSVNTFGGYRVQGKEPSQVEELVAQGTRLSAAGAFALVLELVEPSAANEITQLVGCPTIGIGSGDGCSGQIQVLHDVIGLSPVEYRHARKHFDGATLLRAAIKSYVEETRRGKEPPE